MISDQFSIADIPAAEFEFTFARSGGPGGQNVNKVNSKALLRFAVATSPSLPEDIRARFLSKFGSRLTIAGEIVITSQKHRDQSQNISACLDRLAEMIESVAAAPIPRRKTKPSRASVQKRLETKHKDSARKKQRQIISDD